MKRSKLHQILRTLSANTLAIIVSFVIILLFFIPRAESFILAITAVIVLWYTVETHKMRKQIADDNELRIMPILGLKWDEKKREFVLGNFGQYPAFNIQIVPDRITFSVNERGGEVDNEQKKPMSGMICFLPIFSLMPNEKQPLALSHVEITEKSGTFKGIVDEHEINDFLSKYFFPSLEEGIAGILLEFENILGKEYELKFGLRQKFVMLGRPRKKVEIAEEEQKG